MDLDLVSRESEPDLFQITTNGNINQWVRSFYSTSRNLSNEQWWWSISKKVQINLYWRPASDNLIKLGGYGLKND